MKYDKTRFINNIYNLAKKQKVKIGELEADCGVSTGYLARLRQEEKNAAPGADFLMSVADRLSVSVDALLSFDFIQATDSEKKLQSFMEKLIRETEMRKLIWQRDPVGYPYAVPMNPDGTSAHPLFMNKKESLLSEEEMAADDLPESISLTEIIYRSLFRPDLDDLFAPEIYRCFFPKKKVLYLAVVIKPGQVIPGPAQWTELELVMTGPGLSAPIPFAHTDHDKPDRLDNTVAHLFNAVKDAVTLPQLTPEASAIIDDYLK